MKKGKDWQDVVIVINVVVVVVGGLNASLSLLFVTHRTFSHRHTSSCWPSHFSV
jgi:hypothetical protein